MVDALQEIRGVDINSPSVLTGPWVSGSSCAAPSAASPSPAAKEGRLTYGEKLLVLQGADSVELPWKMD